MLLWEDTKDHPRKTMLLMGSLGIATTFLSWFAVTGLHIISPLFLPSPLTVAKAFITLGRDFNLLSDIGASVTRVLIGFILSAVAAVPLGICLGINKKCRSFFDPLLSAFRYIPPSAFVPLFILWFGIGDLQKIILIFTGVTPYLALLVFDVVVNTKQEFIETAYTMGAESKNILFNIIIPSALPGIWDSLRIMMGAAWTFVVLGEIVASTVGLGHLIIVAQRFLQTPNVIAGIIVIGTFGVLTDLAFKVGYKLLFPWSKKSRYA